MTTKPVFGGPGSLPPARAFPYQTLYEVNERCIELLVNAARSERPDALPLVRHLREMLRKSDPEIRHRAAARSILLVDIAFNDGDWWRGVRLEPTRRRRGALAHTSFPRRTAVPLARATLMLAWYAIKEDLDTATVLLGMARDVAEVIAALQLSEIDTIAERRFRHVLPRWHDQPDYWCELFEAARSGTPGALRRCNIRGLQMIVGEQLRLANHTRARAGYLPSAMTHTA
ncbi:MAG TPA: hypothetical protein VG963_22880 [Polyangiaceae bacterium]|nr:hypothetical protein [Polyangiaceae bacterium]